MKVSFISLGCDKNRVNTEQMMGVCATAGYDVCGQVEGSDVVVVNTCGFIDSAKVEAIETILEMVELKNEGLVGKILVTGCLSQRYGDEFAAELPEVDGIMGTADYGRICEAVEAVAKGEKFAAFSSIDGPVEELPRVLTTPPHYAYLRIAEGCSNKCAYCVIPSLRGKYRSRAMEDILAEAKALADDGVKECIVIAQDITRYGVDLYREKKLPALLRELCKLDFTWIRLHYLYPDAITDELLETIASEPKICHYLDIPIQHCADPVLTAMRRRETKAGLYDLFRRIRQYLPDAILRTSLITGLPYEDEEAFEELCQFLRDVKLQRVGAFAFSPEEGTEAALMENRVDAEEAARRADLITDIQSEIMDEFNDSRLGDVVTILCDGFDEENMCYMGRTYGESPTIDGGVFLNAERELLAGEVLQVRLTSVMDGEMVGEVVEVD